MATSKVTLTLDEAALILARQCADELGESLSRFTSRAIREAAFMRWPRPTPTADQLLDDERAALLDELERDAGRRLDDLDDEQARRAG